MAQRDIPFAERTIDSETISDLFCVVAGQVQAADKASEAFGCDIVIPYSEEILGIIFDGVGAPDDKDFREPFFDMFFEWVLDEAQTLDEFLKEFYLSLEDHLHMYSVRMKESTDS
ncbi:hypothetical protein Q3O60_17520 [Alkalimonas collagenimarina]|uniref:Uncharacterized protein n=1 Tax=Alkalimonas collagenimarina TaxID=400390 RepID=A0ABT9H3W9_9GAMM|nr:hypothetical protein [Alkalimonas collagenimarina]MDP4537982.1 hypothetical protein [Alkalimonas collagenimarina]